MTTSRRNPRWRAGWGRPLARTAMISAGVTALLVWAVFIAVAVFGEPVVDGSGTPLVLGMVVSFLVVGLTLSIVVSHPGWRTGVAGAVAAVLAAVGGWLVYSSMPTPGPEGFITHRDAVASLAFGFGVLGGGLITLGELATDGRATPERHRPPTSLGWRVGVLAVSMIVLVASAGLPAMHEWAETANTEAERASAAPTVTADLALTKSVKLGEVGFSAGTPYGLLATENLAGVEAVTMIDAATGEDRWSYRRWSWRPTQQPVLTADSSVVVLSASRRDDPALRQVVQLDADTGQPLATVDLATDPGIMVAATPELLVYMPENEDGTVVGRDLSGAELWRYTATSECRVSAVAATSDGVVIALRCTGTKDGTGELARLITLDPRSGDRLWKWKSGGEGIVVPESLIITGELVLVDVRRDTSGGEGLYAAREYRHNLAALSMSDGERRWQRRGQQLGRSYSAACAGTLRLASAPAVPVGDNGDSPPDQVVLGECHQRPDGPGATFDVVSYDVDSGETVYTARVPLGFTPTSATMPPGWFAVLPDGRVAVASDVSMDITKPDCRMFVMGKHKKTRLPTPEELADSAWCHHAVLHLTPGALAVSYTGSDGTPRAFALR